MREVAASRTVDASPPIVRRLLTPERVVEAEGSFRVRDVSESGESEGREGEVGEGVDGTVVTASRAGVGMRLRFEEHEDGLAYELLAGPVERLTTSYAVEPSDDGATLTATSTVAVGGPAILDRVAAWKRRGELDRALTDLADELE
jgi:hypothetical protein